MPLRKSFWLYSYDQVKYRTPIQWGVLFAVGLVLALLAGVGVWSTVYQYKSRHTVDTALVALTVMCFGMAFVELPAALIFFYRRWRGEITGYFDYEVLTDGDADTTNGVDHGPDHH